MNEATNRISENDMESIRIIRDAKAVDLFLERLDQEIQREFADNG